MATRDEAENMLDSTEYTRVTSMELDEVEDAQDEEHDEDDLRQTQTIKERRNSEIFHPHSVIAMRRDRSLLRIE